MSKSHSHSVGAAQCRPIWFHRAWVGLLTVGTVALALRLLHLSEIQHNPFFYHPIVDSWDYDSDAWTTVQTGNWIGNRIFFQAPLTTYFLAAIYRIAGHNLFWPRLVQALVGTFTAVGAFALGRRLFGERAAWIAGLATAFYSLLIFYEGELLAPTITVSLDVALLLVLFIVVLSKPGWQWAIPGFLFGLRALATTNNLATVPVFWAWICVHGRHLYWTKKQIILTAAAFIVGISMAIAPVTIRNWVLQKHLVLVSSNAGLNFYLGNSGDYQAKIAMRPGADWDEFVNRHVRAGLRAGPEMSAYFFEESWKYIRGHPLEYVRLLAYKAYLFLRGDELLRNQEVYPFRNHSPVLRLLLWKLHVPGGPGLAFPFGVLLPLAWPGCLLVLRRRHPEGGLLLGFTVAYSASVIAFFITARYRMPVVVPLVLLAAYGWGHLHEWWHSRRWRTAVLCGMVVLGLVSNWNSGPMSKEMNADAYFSLASTLKNQGDLAGSEAYYKKALELNPRDVSAWINLGLHIYEQKGMLDKAEFCYRKALSLRPGYAIAVFNLGRLAELRNRPAEAEELYYEAARLDPLMSRPYHNLATMALYRGDYKQAQKLYRQAYLRDPSNPKTLIGLGITTFKNQGLEPALVIFDEARRQDPGNADIYYNLAIVYAQANLPSEAADAARKAVEANPLDNEAYILFADQMRMSGRVEEARRFLRRSSRRWPDLPGPREALARLNR